MQELGVKSFTNISRNSVYKPVNNTLDNIIDKHKSMLEDNFNIRLSEKDLRVPLLYWNSKQHKTPYKARFIAGATHCTTKPLSVELSLVMKCIKKHFKAYCEQIHQRTGISPYWSVDNSLDCIKKLQNMKAKSVYTFDFSTLYTNLPLKSIEEALQQLVIKMFKNSSKHYILVNTFFKTAFWSDSPKSGYKVFTLDKVLDSLHWILYNTYVRFGDHLFRQEKGIPMGGNCSPLIADLYLSWLEYKYVTNTMKNNFPMAKQLSYNSRYIDDIITPNISNFLDIASHIYPKELPLERSSSNSLHDCFLDLDILVKNNKFVTKIYHKVDLFNFEVISYPFPDSNIPSRIGYNTFLSQLVRFSRVCTFVEDFAFRTRLIYDKLADRGYDRAMLKRYFIKFCCTMSDRVCSYGYYSFSTFFDYCTKFTVETCNQDVNNTQTNDTVNASPDPIQPMSFDRVCINLKTVNAPIPLMNIGNTCYLNTSLQILFMMNQVFNFGHWISKDANYSHALVSDFSNYLAFYKFLYLSTLQNTSKEHLLDFLSILNSIDDFFVIGPQKDAHEAFLRLLNIFDAGRSVFLPDHRSIKNTYFQGWYKVVQTCTNCNHTFSYLDDFVEIRVLPSKSAKTAIINELKDDRRDCHCVNCGSITKQIFSFTIFDHPRLLFVLISRYKFSDSYARPRKDCSRMVINDFIELHGQRYTLGGIITHEGASVNSGHYTACVEREGVLYT